MRLRELEPEFLKITGEDTFRHYKEDGSLYSLSEADGVLFLCPVCFKTNSGPIGTHSVICWQPHVPQNIGPVPGRWSFSGTGLNDLTLTAGSSSILLMGGCNAHFFITNGEIK